MASETTNWLIRGGTIVDGTGAEAQAADLRVRDGRIAEIGSGLAPGGDESVFDAAGCLVTPGFIESHTHYDGCMWWQSDLEPLPGYGVTSMVMGNCGFGLAPLSDDPAVREEVIRIFGFFEDFPAAPFHEHLPWDWRRWSEYRRSMEEKVRVPVHYATFASHIVLRLAAMGLEAWERAAKPAEIATMRDLLEDALAAGALGLASNLFDHDGDDRPIPTMHAEDAEFRALFEVVARHPGASFQLPVDNIMRMTAAASVERVARLAEGLPLRVQWAGVPNEMWQKEFGIQAPMVALHERFAAEGRDFWTGFMHAPITTSISSRALAALHPVRRLRLARGGRRPRRRRRSARCSPIPTGVRAHGSSWDEECNETAPFRNPEPILLELSDNGRRSGRTSTLGEYAAERGLHCSDALAEWMLENGIGSTVRLPDWEKDVEMTLRLLRDPKSVGNISDAGAHGQMFCGAGDNVLLLTQWVRDQGLLSIEEAIHALTGKLAGHFGFTDRGELVVGKRADIVVFDLDEIQHRPKIKVRDVPNGQGGFGWRYFPPEKRATALAIYSSGIHFGVLFGLLAGGWISEFFGWRVAFFVVGLPGILLAVLVRLTVREPPRGASEGATIDTEPPAVGEVFAFLRGLRSFRHLALASAFMAFAGYGLSTWTPAFLIRVHGMGPGEVGTWYGLITGIFGATGAFVGGWWTDRWGAQDARWYLWIPALGAVVGIPFVLALLFWPDPHQALLLSIPSTLAGAMWLGPIFSMTQTLAKVQMRAVASAILLFIINIIGLGLGPQAVGILNDVLEPRYGVEAVRWSLAGVASVMSVWAGVHYALGARTLRQDLQAKDQ